ncbi:MAG: 50S ribosomal protein L4 [Ignavibacteria bacterium GWA2_55_11]|uniref:Large ribosomal subunit protein uL4 n=1 Tax=uncultured Ignavibacteria bacterium Rifle_16ft_4_minimus_16666 TaxID=1665099 RepID=A0A0H4TLC6_9BACT|nr:50S ribosomal protein L4, large subunit ribosomal protein L4 [uncultured Ignavibacteria bacterium Rifle_16ft_4_minimus_16666]OGU32650.1 MAG: 50S ribosomal protein L4 [Ignavibacteria bacterium GWA2_55_11]
MQLDVYKTDGTTSGEKITLDPAIFEIVPNDHAIYMMVRSTMANQRQGTHKVKPRNEVSGGGRKPFKQKKTGRARAGTTRSPLWVGGGSIFGPKPHDYVVKLPAKVRKLARKSALAYKAKDGAIVVVEDFQVDAPKTRQVVQILKALSLGKKKTLLLTKAADGMLYKSGRNIPTLAVNAADKASTYDILNNQVLLIQKSAVDVLQQSLKN